MLIDMHAHSSAVSRCCRMTFEEIMLEAEKKEISGVVLTNHYQKTYVNGNDIFEFVEKYIGEFYASEKLGAEKKFRVFFGIEVTMERYPNVHMLIYGVEPKFLTENPFVFDMTQSELYNVVKKNNGVLIQAHPFRNGTTVLDTEYLDGVEINCHPLYGKSYSKQLREIAQENHLILSCGGDFHADTYRPKCGMLIPESVSTCHDMSEYLLSDEEKVLCIQEPNDEKTKLIPTKNVK